MDSIVKHIAEYYFEPETQQQLIDFIVENNGKLPITVLGGCSNVLIRDGGVKGVVINTRKMNNVLIKDNQIICDAGAFNTKIFSTARNNLIPNYEFLGTIPGTIGGAIKSNAGCYGWEIKDILLSVKTIDLQGEIKIFSNKECGFMYRANSLPDDIIYLEVALKTFDRVDDINIIENKYQEHLQKREATQPYRENTCGSTFRNPAEIPAWKLIQQLGLQDVNIGGAKFSPKHANFIVNFDNATAKDIEDLINLAVLKAKQEQQIDLIKEVVVIGEK